jgi:hypothetical protein
MKVVGTRSMIAIEGRVKDGGKMIMNVGVIIMINGVIQVRRALMVANKAVAVMVVVLETRATIKVIKNVGRKMTECKTRVVEDRKEGVTEIPAVYSDYGNDYDRGYDQGRGWQVRIR